MGRIYLTVGLLAAIVFVFAFEASGIDPRIKQATREMKKTEDPDARNDGPPKLSDIQVERLYKTYAIRYCRQFAVVKDELYCVPGLDHGKRSRDSIGRFHTRLTIPLRTMSSKPNHGVTVSAPWTESLPREESHFRQGGIRSFEVGQWGFFATGKVLRVSGPDEAEIEVTLTDPDWAKEYNKQLSEAHRNAVAQEVVDRIKKGYAMRNALPLFYLTQSFELPRPKGDGKTDFKMKPGSLYTVKEDTVVFNPGNSKMAIIGGELTSTEKDYLYNNNSRDRNRNSNRNNDYRYDRNGRRVYRDNDRDDQWEKIAEGRFNEVKAFIANGLLPCITEWRFQERIKMIRADRGANTFRFRGIRTSGLKENQPWRQCAGTQVVIARHGEAVYHPLFRKGIDIKKFDELVKRAGYDKRSFVEMVKSREWETRKEKDGEALVDESVLRRIGGAGM